jgi:glyoxylase-like metal-dependent hydrolase (beta-lactamase superfamily II)
MIVETLVLGDFETNSYVLVENAKSRDCVIIDTGLSAGPLVNLLKERRLNPLVVVFTHGHADHIGGVNALRKNWPDINAAIHADDADMLTDPVRNLSVMTGGAIDGSEAEIIIDSEGPTDFGGMTFEVLHTPGHTAGGISLYSKADGIVFSGDALFAGSIGRTDFPGGNYEQLITGIKSRLLALPDETKVYTGHGPATTIGTERLYNQYLQ